MAHKVSANWLLGLTRLPEIVDRFPFLLSLKRAWQTDTANCSSCGAKATRYEFGNQANEVIKILASIPETEVNEFKRLTQTNQLILSYKDIRGTNQQIVR